MVEAKELPVRNFGRITDAVSMPDLVAIQRNRYAAFLQKDVAMSRRKPVGLEGLFREIFPIESCDNSMKLEYLGYELGQPRYAIKQTCHEPGTGFVGAADLLGRDADNDRWR